MAAGSERIDRAIWTLPALDPRVLWVLLVIVVLVIVAVCWLARYTRAIRIKIPGFFVWEGAPPSDGGTGTDKDR
jgi:hypothetical protein